MADPLISILIPCYNAAPWVEDTLRSACAQTWPNLEIIVVDDGSSDDSFRLASPFQSPRCQIVRQTHSGASAARNHAFTYSRGEFIQYLDADDLLAPDKLEQQMRIARHAGKQVLSFGSIRHFHDSPDEEARKVHPACLLSGDSDPCEFLASLWSNDGPLDMVQTSQWLTPRGMIEKAGPWDESLSVDDDGEFFARVVLSANTVAAAPLAWSHYRKFRNGANLSARSDLASSMRAAQLKAAHLLHRSPGPRARRAVQRLVTREIIKAYPKFTALVQDGSSFLGHHGLRLSDRLEGSPWFSRLYPIIGWKAARWLQSQRPIASRR